MKILTILSLLLFCSINYAQNKGEIDSRLYKTFEGSQIEKIYKERPDYYKYIVYSLDHSIQLIDKKAIPSKNRKEITLLNKENGEGISSQLLFSKEFSWFSLPIKQAKDENKYYKLSDGKYVVLLSLLKLKEDFLNTNPELK